MDYLLTACTAAQATTLVDVVVHDGPPAVQPPGTNKHLVIGGEWTTADLSRAAAFATQETSMGNRSRNELVSISCQARSGWGAEDMASRRAEAFGIVAAVEQILAADPTLGGLSYGDAQVGAVDEVRQIQQSGAGCIVSFTVTATALLWDG
jgi:hypothetical protein